MRVAQNGDVELLKLRAQCFFALGDLDNAVRHLQQALRADPDNSTVRTFYRKMKDIEDKKSKGQPGRYCSIKQRCNLLLEYGQLTIIAN